MRDRLASLREMVPALAWSVAIGLFAVGVGAAGVVDASLGLAMTAGLLVLAFVIAQRPSPSSVLLALPVSLIAPTLALIPVGGRSIELTVPDLVIAASLLAWAITPVRPPRYWLNAHLVLILWTSVSIIVSDDVGRSLVGLKIVVEAALASIIASTAAPARFERFAWSAGLMSVGLTLQLALRGSFSLITGDLAGAQLVDSISLMHNSMTALTLSVGRSNYIGAMILLGALPIVAYLPSLAKPSSRLLAVLLFATSGLGIAATASRSQLLAFGGIILLSLLRIRREKQSNGKRGSGAGTKLMLLFAAAALAFLASDYIRAIFQPVISVGWTGYNSVNVRYELWRAATLTLLQNPVVGAGVFGLTLVTSAGLYPNAHNVLLQVGAETGFVGLLIYCYLLFIPIKEARGAFRGVCLIYVSGLLMAGLAEVTLRTGPYDYVAWTILGVLVARARESSEPSARSSTSGLSVVDVAVSPVPKR